MGWGKKKIAAVELVHAKEQTADTFARKNQRYEKEVVCAPNEEKEKSA